ncbi:hypothetical protein [Zavarzinia aquatilis]|uniref:Uncharacterized protein n=1 Tax=Zavarzinia aquatilis TaxID=2211142 RepID=A0A317E7J5_9PROT|nr:hypothetical protein [Zavarzinia aquatilis]PWR22909.1 hypothetical protein DKG74_10860 [Zavarzinia aquatilis]
MRAAVFAAAGLQVALFLLLLWQALFIQSDAAGNGMAEGFAVVAGIACAVSALPALILAYFRRALVFALIWATLPLLFLFVLLG